jgi:T5SS/PEP-CTERM-associated repeat protein
VIRHFFKGVGMAASQDRKSRRIKPKVCGMLVTAVSGLTATASFAQNDLWTNPNGGNWSSVSNWSLGHVPVVVEPPPYPNTDYFTAQFSNGAVTPYTVIVDSPASTLLVQNDQVILNYNGRSYVGGYSGHGPDPQGIPLQISSASGQISDLTLQNGKITSIDPPIFTQSGGVATLTMQSFGYYVADSVSYNPLEGPFLIGGTTGAVFNYNQIGGDLGSYRDPIEFGNGVGTVNVSLSGLTVHTDAEGEISFNANATLMNTTLTNSYDLISFSGTANVSGGFIEPGALLLVGATVYYNSAYPPPNANDIPATGATNAVFNASNTVFNVSEGLVVGSSGATATVSAFQSTIESASRSFADTELWVGISGTGIIHLSGGSTLDTDAAHIGYNGGTGTVTLSGAGTAWNSSGAISIGTKALDAAVDLDNGTIELDHNATFTLTAAGSIGGLLNISGGTLSVLSGSRVYALAMNESSGSTLQIGLDGPSAAANGQLIIDNTAIFAGTLDVTLEGRFIPTTGEAFQLFSFGSETGQFSTVDLPPNAYWDLSQLYTTGVITAVPEPGAVMLSMLAFAGVPLRRRRRVHQPH